MCCSVTPHQTVRFSGTVLYGAEVQRPDGMWVHVLGYQNQVGEPRAGRRPASPLPAPVRPARGPDDTDPDMVLPAAVAPKQAAPKAAAPEQAAPEQAAPVAPEDVPPSFWSRLFGRKPRATTSGNAMLLAIPARSGSVTSKNVVDTSQCLGVLDRYLYAVDVQNVPIAAASSNGGAPRTPRVEVFEAAGIYTVVLADEAAAIPGALARVPEHKRPALNPALFAAYARWYPGWTFALCCFDSRDAGKAHPLVWWYAPLDESRLFLPALDCHTGDVPDLRARVKIDHVIAVGSSRAPERDGSDARRVYVDDLPPSAKPFFVNRVVGDKLAGMQPNGDFVLAVDDVRAGVFKPQRARPPGA